MTTVLFRKDLVFAVIVLFIGAGIVPSISSDEPVLGNIIYVDDDVDLEWYNATYVKTIQERIDNFERKSEITMLNLYEGEHKKIEAELSQPPLNSHNLKTSRDYLEFLYTKNHKPYKNQNNNENVYRFTVENSFSQKKSTLFSFKYYQNKGNVYLDMDGKNRASNNVLPIQDNLHWENVAYTTDNSYFSIFPDGKEINRQEYLKKDENTFIPGEIIVKFKKGLKNNEIVSENGIVSTGISSTDQIFNKYCEVINVQPVFHTSNNPFVDDSDLQLFFKFLINRDQDIFTVLKELSNDSSVDYAEPNYIYHTCMIPNDPNFGLQWALYQSSDYDIDAPEAWDFETGDENVVIAIIDTGVDYTHSDLSGNIWINTDEILDGNDTDGNGYIDDIKGWNFCNHDNDPKDDFGHGTHCGGIASAVTNNGVGIAGVCWNCTIMPLKGLNEYGSGGSDDLANAIVYAADNGANVISMSWGSGSSSELLKDALNYAYSTGVILVAAAGNDNVKRKHYPAANDNVIAVSATNSDDEKASFSNYGSWVDVAAPGVYIYSTMPTYDVTMTEEWGYEKFYDSMSGTSMACPHVAGLAALILSKNPALIPMEILTILRSTTDDIDPNEYIGIGRINAYNAIVRDSTPIANMNSSLDDADAKGTITVNGTAAGSTFLGYTLYYGEGIYPSTWTYIGNSFSPVIDDVLVTLDTSLIPDGIYTIRLVVDDVHGKTSEDRLILTFDNMWMSHPLNNDIFRAGDVIEIEGTVNGSTFQNYIIDWGIGENPSEWFTTGVTLANNGQIGIVDDTLATWDTSFVTDGDFFTLRLTVYFTSFQSVEFVKNIYLDPTLKEGWPQRINSEFVEDWWGSGYYWVGYVEPIVSDIDNDGNMEVIVYTGGGPTKIYVFKQDGSMLEGWPVEVDDEVLPGGNLASPSVADIDNDGYKEIFVNGKEGIYIYNHDGTFLRLITLKLSSQPTIDTTLSDLNNDGELEIIRKYDPIYEEPYLGQKVAVLDQYGNMLDNWPQLYYNLIGPDGLYQCSGSIESTPAVGNFDDDPEKEIVVAGVRNVFDDPANPHETWHCEGRIFIYNLDGTILPGFPADIDGKIFSSPSIGDIDNDGYDEIIVATMKSDNPNSGLYIIDRFGNSITGWPQLVGESIWTSPAIADFNNDGFLEIVASTLGSPFSTYIFNYEGNILPGWPQYTTWNDYRSPIVGDINNDNIPDIITTAGNGFSGGGVYAWNLNGTMIEGFPKVTEVDAQASATIADIDNDGKVELVVSSDFDSDLETGQSKHRGSLYVWELNGNYNPLTMHWPIFHHDNQRTGKYVSPPVYVDDDFNSSTPGWQIDHFDKIQDAIYNIPIGGTVFVFNGIYNENVLIGKSLDLIGENKNNVIINGDGVGTVVYVYADQVKISGFKIQNGNYGIILDSSNNIISDNNVFNNYYGVRLYSSNNNILDSNISNNNYGIRLSSANSNTITENTITDNIEYGIYIFSSSYVNNIYHNNFIGNSQNSYDECTNNWDNGYPIGGNYWDDYTGTDNNGDGIGNIPYYIPGGSNQDSYPLMHSGLQPDIVFIDDDYTSSTVGWGYDHFNKIQYGINRVQEHGTVHVSNGAYYENIVVDKTIDLVGEDKNNTIIDGGGNSNVIYVSADNVNINGFKIRNGDFAGIDIWSSYNNISENIIRSNNNYGIILHSSNNIMVDNKVFNNHYGIRLYSSDNYISGNNVSNNNYGIRLSSSSDNTISDNVVVDNINYGIYIYSSSNNNIIYHNNLLRNNQNAYDECSNTWDNGYQYRGNYWDDYTGSDSNGDYIGDTPYNITGDNNQDNYPVMVQNGWLWPASFTGNFDDYGLDTDNDGLYNYLVVEAEVEVFEAGEYGLYGSLRFYNESSGWWNSIDYDYNYTDLDPGFYTISLEFEGCNIYNNDYNGSFKADFDLYDTTNWNWIGDEEYMTQSYNYTDFERPTIEFTGLFEDYGLDTDFDASYNYLVVEAEVEVFEAGNYRLSGDIYYYNDSLGWWNYFDYESNYTYLDVGVQTVSLEFDGYNIYNLGYNGSFKASLDLYEPTEWIKMDETDYITQHYDYTEFQRPIPDYYEPDDDYLNATLIATDGTQQCHDFHVAGDHDWLKFIANEDVSYIIETSDLGIESDTYMYLYALDGVTEIIHNDDGGEGLASRIIWDCNLSGSYYIKVRHYSSTACGPDTYYNISVLEWIPPAEFTDNFNDYGLDNDGNGLFDYLVIEAEINVSQAEEFHFSGELNYYNEMDETWDLFGCYAWNHSYLDIGIHTVLLEFNGHTINNLGYNGTFKADISLANNLYQLDYAEYYTNFYNYTDFQEPDTIPPNITDVQVPDYVGVYHPGNISANITDNNLQQVSMMLYDYYNITFNQSLVIWYYLDDSGESGTYVVSEYNGTYANLEQAENSTSASLIMLSNWTQNDKVYMYANFKKNQTASWTQIFLEFNLSNGLLNNLAIPSISQLEYITNLIEPGVSIVNPFALIFNNGWTVLDLNCNYTLYSIGDSNNPYLSFSPLENGEYTGLIQAYDTEYNMNSISYNLSVNHSLTPNNPPNTPGNPDPSNGSVEVIVTPTLSWICGDPDPGDTVTYDVYFGTSTPPPIVTHNQSTNLYNPGQLDYNTTYYWKIVAWDNHGASTEGIIWNFTTEIMEEITVMGLNPSSDIINIGENFTITIYIDPTEPIGGWQIYGFNFTQGIVNATDITPGAFWETNFDPGNIDNENGTITDVQVWSLGPYPDVNHTACIINFTAIQPSICTFEIKLVDISNDTFENIPVLTIPITITVIENTPPDISDENPVNGSTSVERPPAELGVTVEDPDGELTDVYIRLRRHDYYHVGEWVSLETYLGVGNGTYNFLLPVENDWIWGNTTYTWSVNVTDGTYWTNKTFTFTTGGSRYDVNNNDIVNFQDAGLVWIHRTSEVDYDGIYDVNQNGEVNFQDAGLTWVNRD